MNGIRYRQWWENHWFHWGFIGDWAETGFIGPLCTSDRNDPVRTYPESFQSTGFHDNTRTEEFPKGKEIWEESVISFDGPNISQPYIGVVIWDKVHGRWSVRSKHQAGPAPLSSWFVGEMCTVIGNTMQNPKMMEVKT